MNDKWNKYFLGMAEYVATASKDPSTKVGAVITDYDCRVVSVGYNGFAKGVDDKPERYADRDTKLKMIVHAECNAIIFAKSDLKDHVLYTVPFMPCARCAAMVIQAGIKTVIAPYNDNPRWQEDFTITREMFKEAGVELVEIRG